MWLDIFSRNFLDLEKTASYQGINLFKILH